MPSIEELRARLSRVCIARAARVTGLHYNTVYRIAKGTKKNPSYETIRKLSDYLGNAK